MFTLPLDKTLSPKSYKVMRTQCGKKPSRYNSKTFSSYEEARKYVRKLVTKLYGKYSDGYTSYGFKVVPL